VSTSERLSLRHITVEQIEPRSIEWLDKPLLQGSAFHLIAGPKGVGKGTWIAKTTAKFTRGLYGEKTDVLIVSSEDSAAIDTRPRLSAARADLERVHLVLDDIHLPGDLDRLQELAVNLGNVGLIVVDPLGNHLGGVDTDKEGAVRHAIAGLNKLADELGCAILGVRHIGKARQNGALSAVLGSTAWVDLPRAVLMFAPDDEDDAVFHVQVVAGNRSGRTAAQSYKIELRDVGLKEPVTHAVELGDSAKDVDHLLTVQRRTTKSQTARDLILDVLEQDGDQESDTLDARIAAETGLTARTVQNQRVELKNAGLIRNVAVRDEIGGEVKRWKVVRTEAPRPVAA
jgi:hypothetical protein